MKKRIADRGHLRYILTAITLPVILLTGLLIAHTSSAGKRGSEGERAKTKQLTPLNDPNMPPHIDARRDALNAQRFGPNDTQQRSIAALSKRLGGTDRLKVVYNGLTGTPSRLSNPQGYLTAPSGESPESIARGFIADWSSIFRFDQTDLSTLKLVSRAVTQEGTTIMLFQQQLEGLPVYQGDVLVNVSKLGQVINVGGNSYPEITAANSGGISAEQAVTAAANAMNIPFNPQSMGRAKILAAYGNLKPAYVDGERFSKGDTFSEDIAVQKVIFPVGNEGRLAYKFVLRTPQYYGIMWLNVVDAGSGEILQRLSLTAFQNETGGGVGNNRQSTFRPDVQNMLESYYQPGGSRGKVFDTNPATVAGAAGVGRPTRTGALGSYMYTNPTYGAEVDSNRFRFSIMNARNESPLFFNSNAGPAQSFTQAAFPAALGQVTRGMPDANFPTSASPFGWFYLPTGSGGAEIAVGDNNRAATRVAGYTISAEGQARNVAGNSPTGDGTQPFSADVTTLGAPVTLNDGRVLSSVIQSRYTEGNNVVVADDRIRDDDLTRGVKGYAVGRQFTAPYFDYLASYEFGGANATGGGTGSTTPVNFPPSSIPDVFPGTVSLFYLNNLEHDYLYSIGFTEQMWNFQFDNFGKGGAGQDGIIAEVQDGSGVNNANMGTPDEGGSPTMQMFLFTDGSFHRSDGDFDWDVVAHEQYHGVSNRSAGKGMTNCLGTPLVGESGGMGEGWSDFIASSLADDDAEGEYLTGNLDQGIRRVPVTNYRYSYGSINNQSLNVRQNLSATDNGTADINAGGIPFEVHDIGEVWSAVLWDMRELMIVKQKVNNTYPGIFFDGNKRFGSGTTFFVGDRAIQSVDAGHPINYRLGFGTDDGTVAPFPAPVLPTINASDIVRPGVLAAENSSGAYPKREGPLATAVAKGARLADKITLRGLQLVACNPSFVDMRDAMINADREITGGENVAIIWRSFASHGVGSLASSPNSGNGGAAAVVEDFTVPATVTACESLGPLGNPAFSVANTTANAATLTITPVSGAADYVIQRGTSATGPFTTVGSTSGSPSTFTFTDNNAGAGLTLGQTYFYQVHARRNADCVGGADVHNVTITVGAAPIVSPIFFGVDSVTDPRTGTSLTVNWSTALTSNPNAAIVYDVHRVLNVALDNDLTEPTFTPTTANRIAQDLVATSFTNNGLTMGQQYYYIVRARDTNNNQTDTNNAGNVRARFSAPTSNIASSLAFAVEDFSQATSNARFTPPLTDSATPEDSLAVFQRVPGVVNGGHGMYAPDFDPGDSGQGAQSNFATYIGPLTLTRSSILEFDHRFTTEAAFDGGNLEILVGAPSADPIDATPFPNNTSTFELNDYLFEGGYSGPLNGTIEGVVIGSPLQGRRSYTGSGTLSHVRAALGDFAPGGIRNPNSLPVHVRFHMSSDVGTTPGPDAGWYVDNVVVNNYNSSAAITISGTITTGGNPLAGVNVALTGTSSSSTTTDANGQYTLNASAGGSYLVTPTMSGYTFDPQSRNYANQGSSVTTADFTAFPTGTNPRTLSVTNTFATATQPVTLPVVLNSQGNEASLTFSLAYNSSILSSPQVACGIDSGAGCALTVNTNTAGQIGVSVDPTAATYTAGQRQVITVTFNTAATTAANTPVTFTDTPATREVSDSNANPLPTGYVDGYVVFAQGIEADVAPRANGNGSVSSTDVSQVRRFAVGLDTFDAFNNEFQRADSAPYATLGNGSVAATDVTQARRYQLGSDPSQPAGGPNGPAARTVWDQGDKSETSLIAGTREVRVISTSTSAGQQVTVTLRADAVGDENNYGFSLSYDQAILSNPLVTIGADATGGNVLANTTTNPGRIGFSVDFGGGTMPAGNDRALVTVRFNVANNAPPGLTPLTFGDIPAVREVSNLSAQALPTTFTDGDVNIAPPSASVASVGGRVLSSNGNGISNAFVTLTDDNGNVIEMRTNPFGYFRFENVLTGATYVASVSAKRYRFQSRIITVSDDIADLDFVGQSGSQ